VVNAIREIVIVKFQSAKPIESPAYDLGLTENEVRPAELRRQLSDLQMLERSGMTVSVLQNLRENVG
jgi:hypothetical protein